jgi:hypothetical protein
MSGLGGCCIKAHPLGRDGYGEFSTAERSGHVIMKPDLEWAVVALHHLRK